MRTVTEKSRKAYEVQVCDEIRGAHAVTGDHVWFLVTGVNATGSEVRLTIADLSGRAIGDVFTVTPNDDIWVRRTT